jgi:Arc/MetJ-type ribon-helix-helix transcriptional regulator
MWSMKVSVSMPDDAIATLDRYVATHHGATRSSALRTAIGLLRERELVEQYDRAMDEWEADDASSDWASTVTDGLAREG